MRYAMVLRLATIPHRFFRWIERNREFSAPWYSQSRYLCVGFSVGDATATRFPSSRLVRTARCQHCGVPPAIATFINCR